MSQSIVEQLRNLRCFGPEHFELLREAADYIEQLEEENAALSAQNINFAEDIEKLTDQLEANQAPSDERAALMELCHIEIMANDKDQTTTSWVSPETPKRMLAALAQIQAAQQEPDGYKHEIIEPCGAYSFLFSQYKHNPWGHWLEEYKEKCQYKVTPLYAAPKQADKASDAVL